MNFYDQRQESRMNGEEVNSLWRHKYVLRKRPLSKHRHPAQAMKDPGRREVSCRNKKTKLRRGRQGKEDGKGQARLWPGARNTVETTKDNHGQPWKWDSTHVGHRNNKTGYESTPKALDEWAWRSLVKETCH